MEFWLIENTKTEFYSIHKEKKWLKLPKKQQIDEIL